MLVDTGMLKCLWWDAEWNEKHVNGNCGKVDTFYEVANITCPNCVLFYGK